MLIAKLSISYDRGLSRNDERDLSIAGASVAHKGFTTADGKVIRGHGTHFKSAADALLVGERDKHAREIYHAVRERFLALPIDGCFIAPEKGQFKKYALSLLKRDDMQVRVSEFELTTAGEMEASEVKEWADKIKRQLGSVQLGRSAKADEDGLRALEY